MVNHLRAQVAVATPGTEGRSGPEVGVCLPTANWIRQRHDQSDVDLSAQSRDVRQTSLN